MAVPLAERDSREVEVSLPIMQRCLMGPRGVCVGAVGRRRPLQIHHIRTCRTACTRNRRADPSLGIRSATPPSRSPDPLRGSTLPLPSLSGVHYSGGSPGLSLCHICGRRGRVRGWMERFRDNRAVFMKRSSSPSSTTRSLPPSIFNWREGAGVIVS